MGSFQSSPNNSQPYSHDQIKNNINKLFASNNSFPLSDFTYDTLHYNNSNRYKKYNITKNLDNFINGGALNNISSDFTINDASSHFHDVLTPDLVHKPQHELMGGGKHVSDTSPTSLFSSSSTSPSSKSSSTSSSSSSSKSSTKSSSKSSNESSSKSPPESPIINNKFGGSSDDNFVSTEQTLMQNNIMPFYTSESLSDFEFARPKYKKKFE